MDGDVKKKVAIVGSGVIGEAAGRGFLRHGYDTVFCDIDETRLAALSGEGLVVLHPDALSEHTVDVFLVSIQTPTSNTGVDLNPIRKAYASIGKAIKHHTGFPVIATRSTVPVGTARAVALPFLEEHSGKRAGKDFGVASNPEYLRELTAFDDFMNPRLVVIGSDDERSKNILEELYRPFGAPIYHVTTAEAEMQKYTHNLLNAAKISFFNEQRKVCEARGISADAIFPLVIQSAEAMWNTRYGTKNLGAYGGACLPKDVKGFLYHTKKELEMDLPLIQSVDEVNERMMRDAKGE